MASIPGSIYAPPGTYTRTRFENPVTVALASVLIPALIGTGNETLFQNDLEVARGSSSSIDQRVVQENLAGRFVQEITDTGRIVLGDADGTIARVQVRNFPIVTGQGTGTTTNDRTAVQVRINGSPVVVLDVDGSTGVVTLTQAPDPGDVVDITYFFNRTDTQITDDVSNQVTEDPAEILGEIGVASGETYSISEGINDVLTVTVDTGSETDITLTAGDFTAAQIAALINGQAPESLVASAFNNSEGKTAIRLAADHDIVIGDGSANSVLGFTAGESTERNRTFFTWQGPIVDGTNGGITTTDPADVVVRVDNVQVIPTAVDGANRSVTLPFAPANDETVTIQYYFNTWENTFDFLANVGITEVLQAGVTPGRRDFVQGVDFILKDDKILWGTASTVEAGSTTSGSTPFGPTQVSTTLVDYKTYLSECEPVVDTSVNPPVDSGRVFQLPFQPTTGNGRNSPLGTETFQSVSNDRIDLPTNRPDLVDAYWGYSLQDALDRGAVEVVKVDSSTSTIELRDPIERGAKVWATFYYNLLQDQEYTLTVQIAGPSGVGTYTIEDNSESLLYGGEFTGKSSELDGITVNFPRGSELLPDLRFEGGSGGPVDEVVTVEFITTQDSPAQYTVPGPSPYFITDEESDQARLKVDGTDIEGAAGIDVSDPSTTGVGFFATLLGDEVVYDADSGGATYDITSADSEISFTVDGVLISGTAATGAGTLQAYVDAINTGAAAAGVEYHGATRFTAPTTIALAEYDKLSFNYVGDTTVAPGTLTVTIDPSTYATGSALAAHLDGKISTAIGGSGVSFTLDVSADSAGRILFTFQKDPADGAATLEFISDATPAEDFAVLAGIDTDAASGTQTKLYDGDIARRYTVGSGPLEYDRLVMRNRILPGDGTISFVQAVEQTGIIAQGMPDVEFIGVESQDTAEAGFGAVINPATLLADIGLSGGQDTAGQPAVTFYDGSGTTAANNVLKLVVDGVSVTVVFTASAGGTLTAIGPETTAGTVINQIAAAMASAGFASTAGDVITAGLIRQEGAGFRINSARTDQFSNVSVGSGSANDTLSLSEGTSDLRDPVSASKLASALMGHAPSGSFSTFILDYASPPAGYFPAEALAGVAEDEVGNEYLYLQSQSTGTASSVAWDTATTDDILLTGTLLLAESGDGDTGEAGTSGFFVTSSDPSDGSGTADTSVFNSGTGQDGFVGQTYRDDVTGLTFTVLPRDGGLDYPSGGSFTLTISSTLTTDGNIPTLAIPGVETLVTNTSGVAVGDTALVSTFERGGSEPSVGSLYYVTYTYLKQDFRHQLYTRLSAIEQNFGEVSPNNPLSLASFLTLINGAVSVGIKQVQKGTDGTASKQSFLDAFDDLEADFDGGVSPDILVPLRGDVEETDLWEALSLHLDVQSSIRYRSERTAIIGFAPLASPEAVGTLAERISSTRIRQVYPDSVLLNLTNALGETEEFLVEGFYLASALSGSIVDPALDVAEPWTGRVLRGFTRLGANLDPVEANRLAQRGVTVLTEANPNLRVRHGLTTDMTNVLTRTPTVIQIVDEVHKRARATLSPFIGNKFLPGITSDVESRIIAMFQRLVREQIVSNYTGVRAEPDPNDPTAATVEAAYQPVFPLLYIVMTFNLRASGL